MADFKTGHAQPAGFTAGAIKDGASLGVFTFKSGQSYNAGGTVEVKVRLVSGILVALCEEKTATGTVVYSSRVKQHQFILNLSSLVVEGGNMTAIANQVATINQLTTLGIADNAPTVPGTASGQAIGWEQSATGTLTKAGGTINPITGLVDTPTTTTTTTSKWKKWMTYALIGVAVVVVAVVGYRYFKK
jgi:hypothetical protein